MHPNHIAQVHQQHQLRHHVSHSHAHTFFNALTGPDLLHQVELLLPAYRERLFPPTETLSMFMSQALSADRSCQKAVNEAAVLRVKEGLRPCSSHTGGYCLARQRLPVLLVQSLAKHTGAQLSAHTPSPWLWHGRPAWTGGAPSSVVPAPAFPRAASRHASPSVADALHSRVSPSVSSRGPWSN